MGYTTDFKGKISINPPLSEKERDYINAFSASRRVNRHSGPYFVEDTYSGHLFLQGATQDTQEVKAFKQKMVKDIIDNNNPPEGQPGLWCQWVASADGKYLHWDGGEKFYAADQWMAYLVHHFIGPDPIAKVVDAQMSFLQPHKLHGTIYAIGEEQTEGIWQLQVHKDGRVYVTTGTWTDEQLKVIEQTHLEFNLKYEAFVKRIERMHSKNPMKMMEYFDKQHRKVLRPLFAALKDPNAIKWDEPELITPGMSQQQQQHVQAKKELQILEGHVGDPHAVVESKVRRKKTFGSL